MAADPTPTLLGRSLQIADGDLALASGDFIVIAGQENFLQGMQVMIDTPFSTDVFNVNYGFDIIAALSSANPPSIIKEFIKLNLVKSITSDNRVRDVSDIAFDDETHFYELNPGADPAAFELARRASRQWQATVVINTVTGGQANLTLQGLGL